METLQSVLNDLNIKNDRELVQIYRYLLANRTKDTFRDKARDIIFQKIIEEIQIMKKQQRNKSDLLEKYLDYSKSSKEYIISSYNDLDQQNK